MAFWDEKFSVHRFRTKVARTPPAPDFRAGGVGCSLQPVSAWVRLASPNQSVPIASPIGTGTDSFYQNAVHGHAPVRIKMHRRRPARHVTVSHRSVAASNASRSVARQSPYATYPPPITDGSATMTVRHQNATCPHQSRSVGSSYDCGNPTTDSCPTL